MNSLTIESLNGRGRFLGTIGSSAPRDANDIANPDPINPVMATEDDVLHPGDWGTMRPMPLGPGQRYRSYDPSSSGEIRLTRTWNSMPMTPSHGERELPRTAAAFPRLPVEPFQRSYPHTWVPYENLQPVASDDRPPMPAGWASPFALSREESAAVDMVLPAPAAHESEMAMDISGLAQIGQVPGMITSLDQDPATQAGTAAVAKQAADAQAAGASPSTVNKIIDFGSGLLATYAKMKGVVMPPKPGIGTKILGADQPFYKRPLFIGGVAVLAGSIGYMAFSGKGRGGRGGTRRRTTRRFRRN